MVLKQLNRIVGQVESYIRIQHIIVHEVFFDDVLFVTSADYEIVDSISRVYFHYMPKNWLATYFNHRFWHVLGLFTETCAKTSCKNHCFHIYLIFNCLFYDIPYKGLWYWIISIIIEIYPPINGFNLFILNI